MQKRMVRLGSFVGRRRRWVIAAWLLVVIAALPLTARQGDELTGGGFDVPGSQSEAVAAAVERNYADLTHGIAVLLVDQNYDGAPPAPSPGAAPDAEPAVERARVAAALDRVDAATREAGEISLRPQARQRAAAQLAATGITIVPLHSPVAADDLIDIGTGLRAALDPGQAATGVTPYLLGQHAAYAGLTELTKEDLIEAE
ncbi:MAG TPA: hypothetical protein VFD37_05545, partial [Solirubrobacterales bacterium]|nr:hypothetical protein [Solirubrobacterales bacterium]